ncbi:MAG: aminodeoxychorismate lyase, partial [Gammaproteobacteria bacterium]
MFKLLSNTRSLLIVIFAVVLVFITYHTITLYSKMNTALPLAETDTIVFSRGSSIRTLANQLLAKDLLKDKTHLLLWGRLNRQSTRLQAGEYLLTPGLSLAALLDDMVAGNVIQYNISLIEGFTFRQILEVIQQNPVLTKELNNLSDEEIMKRLGHEGEHPEGRFYPDTYFISRGVSDLELLARAYTAMQSVLAEEWQQREENLPYKTPYEALIMASIVEKESA